MLKRIVALLVGAALSAGVMMTAAAPALAAPTIVVDTLTVPAAQPGQNVTASAKVRTTSGTVRVQAITIAVRSAGKAYDFPGARQNATIGTGGYNFTSAQRSFPAGTYEAFVAVLVNNRWTNLTPARKFTVTAPAPGKVLVDTLTLPTGAKANAAVSASARVRTSSGTVPTQAITIAVRKDGQAFDFPGAATGVTVPAGGYTFTSQARAFTPGTYQAFVAVRINNQWTNLAPAKTFTVAAAPTAPTPPAPQPNNPLTYANDFKVDGKDWNAGQTHGTARLYSDPCWKNSEGCNNNTTQVEYNKEHAQVKGGSLVITADRKVSLGPDGKALDCGDRKCTSASARLTMIDWVNDGKPTLNQAGGHFEARIKMPTGSGMWPAFWTVGDPNQKGADGKVEGWPANGEIDIAEYFGASNDLETFLHYGRQANPKSDVNWGQPIPGVNVADWHIYSLDWDNSDNGELRFSVDGDPVRTVTAANAKAKDAGLWKRIQEHPQNVIVNLAVGGAGGAVPTGELNKTMEIDYIRVYEQPFPKR